MHETPATLRPLVPADADAAAALIRRAFADQPVATDPPSSALKETAETIGAWIVRGGGVCLARRAALAALLLWDERDRGLYCGRVAVDPAERGRGLARRLVAAAEEEGLRRGLPLLRVKVRLQLPGNIRLFASCGFREAGREMHEGHAAPTLVVMEKPLGVSSRDAALAARDFHEGGKPL